VKRLTYVLQDVMCQSWMDIKINNPVKQAPEGIFLSEL